MLEIRKGTSLATFAALKSEYVAQATAPLDGMWLCGFVPMAEHYGFYLASELIGYCCVNADACLLQFYLPDSYRAEGSELVRALESVHGTSIQGAYVSTAEPQLLTLCTDEFTRFSVHTILFRLAETVPGTRFVSDSVKLTVVDADRLEEAVGFAVTNIGAPAEWLRGYFGNLIARSELFGLWQQGALVATGECRGYDEYQTDYADIGVIVAVEHRSRGIATHVLTQLVNEAQSRGLIPICSTEKDNVASRMAIGRAGFVPDHRILEFREPARAGELSRDGRA